MPREKIERNDRIERRYREGVGAYTIAREERLTPERVRVILRRRGVTAADRGRALEGVE